jgi:hypothetical protein
MLREISDQRKILSNLDLEYYMIKNSDTYTDHLVLFG